MMARSLAPLLAALASHGCNSSPASPGAAETPSRQFVFEGVRMEQRTQGKLEWTTLARRADGDLDSTLAVDIFMTHHAPDGGAVDYEVRSPRGTLDLAGRKATFESVRITDPTGGVLTAGTALYDGAADRLAMAGPLEFVARGLIAHAASGEMQIKDGTMTINGPVQGSYDPSIAPTPVHTSSGAGQSTEPRQPPAPTPRSL